MHDVRSCAGASARCAAHRRGKGFERATSRRVRRVRWGRRLPNPRMRIGGRVGSCWTVTDSLERARPLPSIPSHTKPSDDAAAVSETGAASRPSGPGRVRGVSLLWWVLLPNGLCSCVAFLLLAVSSDHDQLLDRGRSARAAVRRPGGDGGAQRSAAAAGALAPVHADRGDELGRPRQARPAAGRGRAAQRGGPERWRTPSTRCSTGSSVLGTRPRAGRWPRRRPSGCGSRRSSTTRSARRSPR